MESRTLPAARRAISRTAAGSKSCPSRVSTPTRWASSSFSGSRLKVKCWQRLMMVTGNLCGSVVASTKVTRGGGSSSVFSRALNASRVSMWASSMMKTL